MALQIAVRLCLRIAIICICGACFETLRAPAGMPGRTQTSSIISGWDGQCPAHCSLADFMLDAAGMPASAQQQQLLGQVTPHLPAPAPAAQPGPQLQAALARLNLAWAKLLARFLPTACNDVPGESVLACFPFMHEVLMFRAKQDAAADHQHCQQLVMGPQSRQVEASRWNQHLCTIQATCDCGRWLFASCVCDFSELMPSFNVEILRLI